MSNPEDTKQTASRLRRILQSKTLSYAKYLIPFALIVFIALSVDLTESIALLAGADVLLVLAAILLGFPLVIALRTSRWIVVARTHRVFYPFGVSLMLYMAAFSAGSLVSDSVGAFVRSVYLYRDGNRATISVLIPLWEKICELTSLLLLGAIAVVALPSLTGDAQFVAVQIGVSAGILGILILSSSRRAQKMLLDTAIPLVSRRTSRLEQIDRDRVLDDFQIMSRRKLAVLILYSAGIRLVFCAVVYLLARSLAIPMDYWQTVLTISIVSLITMFPVTIAGIGTRDAMLVFMFALFGLSAESAIALSLLILLMSTLWRGLGSLAFPLLGRFKKDDIAAEHNSTGEKLK